MLGQRLSALRSLTRALAESAPVRSAAPRLLEAIAEPLGWEVGAFWLRGHGEQSLSCIGTWQTPELARITTDAVVLGLSSDAAKHVAEGVVAASQPEWLTDVAKHPALGRLPLVTELGVHTFLGFPISAGPRSLGAIELFRRDLQAPDGELLALMTSVGSQIGHDVEARSAEDAARASEALHSSIVESARDCIIVIDHRGRILDFNPAAEWTFGHARAEALGQELAELIVPPSLRERHRSGLARCVETGEYRLLGRRLEFSGVRADGTEFPVELTISLIPGSDPPIFAGSLRDIAERRRVEHHRELLLRRERSQRARAEASQERARHLALQVLEAEEHERARLSQALHDEAVQNLLVVLQDLREARHGDPDALGRAEEIVSLTVSQLREAVFELHPIGGADEGIARAIRAVADRQARRGCFLPRVSIAEDATGFHDQLLFSLARELITNVAKHAGASEAVVNIDRVGEEIRLEVADNGRGFDPDSRDAATEAGHVGLSLVIERVEALGGSVDISSSPGCGASVRANLPASRPKSATASARTPQNNLTR